MTQGLFYLIIMIALTGCMHRQAQNGNVQIISQPTLHGKSPVYDIELTKHNIQFTGLKNTVYTGKYSIPITYEYYSDLLKELKNEASYIKDKRRDFHTIKLILNKKTLYIKPYSETIKKILTYINFTIKKQKADNI